MALDPARINAAAVKGLSAFQERIAGIRYERKGILYSEMFFLYLCAGAVQPRRILESGRARGQSTLLLATVFPDLPVVSIEFDPSSPDVAVAQARLAGHKNVTLRFGDATRILSAEVRQGDVVLIDGPKGFRAVRMAMRLLATGKPQQIFVHDCALGTSERAFLDAYVSNVVYSDSLEFAAVARVLDAECWSDMPPERRFEGDRAPRAYGYGLACIAFDPLVNYRRLLLLAALAGLRARCLKSRIRTHG